MFPIPAPLARPLEQQGGFSLDPPRDVAVVLACFGGCQPWLAQKRRPRSASTRALRLRALRQEHPERHIAADPVTAGLIHHIQQGVEVLLGGGTQCRSEEHTSELQSQSNLVCR